MANITVTPEVVATTIDNLSAKFLAVREAMDALSDALVSAGETLQYATLSDADFGAVMHVPVLTSEMLKATEIRRNAALLVTMAGINSK